MARGLLGFEFGLASVLLLSLGTSACGTGDECLATDVRACSGEDGCSGSQSCGGNPARWLPCECEVSEPARSRVGEICNRDANCEEDEHCFDADDASFLGGAPAVDVCTLRCEDEPELCKDRDPPAVCVVTDDRGTQSTSDDEAHCLERCTLGGTSGDRCRGDSRLACATLESFAEEGEMMRTLSDDEAFVCRPLCASEADCPLGLECDRRTGACVEEVEEADGFGTECDAAASRSSCEGVCVEVEETAYCSHRCRFGTVSCGDEDGPRGLCRFPEEAEGLIGDVGFCAMLCDCNAQCDHPELICEPFDESAVEAIVESAGVCVNRVADGETRAGLSCDGDAGAP